MLTEVCDFVHNYFEYVVHNGTFEISDGTIDLVGLVANGQRFRIIGSALNDGIYTNHEDGIYNDDDDTSVSLASEVFTGTIVAMAVPTAFTKLVKEISDWYDANKAVLESPYMSESFGGYSYEKMGSASGKGNVKTSLSWQDFFGSRLNAYRKIA